MSWLTLKVRHGGERSSPELSVVAGSALSSSDFLEMVATNTEWRLFGIVPTAVLPFYVREVETIHTSHEDRRSELAVATG
jgi:hypothetical protein